MSPSPRGEGETNKKGGSPKAEFVTRGERARRISERDAAAETPVRACFVESRELGTARIGHLLVVAPIIFYDVIRC